MCCGENPFIFSCTDKLTVQNNTCPTGYQAEACACQRANCLSARFVGDICKADQGVCKFTPFRKKKKYNFRLAGKDGGGGHHPVQKLFRLAAL